MSSIDHLVQFIIGLFCLLISNIFYFFYFNSVEPTCDKSFLVAYFQSILYVIVSILFCLFQNSRFKLFGNKKKRLIYSPLNQLEDCDLFEMSRPFTKKTDRLEDSFLTEPIFETISDDEDEDDEEIRLNYRDKLTNYDEYLVRINEKYDEMTKEDVKHQMKDRKVKFSTKKEIRYLSDMYAQSAILSRLSYEAFMQFNYQILNHYSNLAFSNSLSIVPVYSTIHFLSIYFTNLAMSCYFTQPISYFDLNAGFSLAFIILIQYFYFSPTSPAEKITLTKSVICFISLISLFLIKMSSTAPFLHITASSDSIFINQTVLNDSNVTNLFSHKCSSIVYTLISSFLSTLFLVSLRNKYEQDDFDIKVFSLFLSGFTFIVFGALLLFVLNRHITDSSFTYKHNLISILHQGLMGPAFGHFFLVIGSLYTNTMMAYLSLCFILPINYSMNLFSTSHLNHKLFLFSTFVLVVCFLVLIYVTFYESGRSKKKDILFDLMRKSPSIRQVRRSDREKRFFLNQQFD